MQVHPAHTGHSTVNPLSGFVDSLFVMGERLASPKGLAYTSFLLTLLGVGPALIYLDNPDLFIALPVNKLMLLGVMLTGVPVVLLVAAFNPLGSPEKPVIGIHMGAIAGMVSVGACATAAVLAQEGMARRLLPEEFPDSVIRTYCYSAAICVLFFSLVAKAAHHELKREQATND